MNKGATLDELGERGNRPGGSRRAQRQKGVQRGREKGYGLGHCEGGVAGCGERKG